MRVLSRIILFAAAVITLGGLAGLAGRAVGPFDVEPASHEGGDHDGPGQVAHDDEKEVAEVPGGLMVAQDGYSLELVRDSVRPGADRQLRFRIRNDGDPLTTYERVHGKDLHLIVVRRDLTGYQHLHPVLDGTGTWSVPVDLRVAGEYRVFTDFKPAGSETGYTLGADLSVPGRYAPRRLPPDSATASVGGYDVELAGELVPGTTSQLTMTVRKDGVPVRDLEPYLEAYGHLVAIRDGDLAYLHVHPDGHPGDGVTQAGPEITFQVEVPSTGSYRLFLDFRHGSAVHTAAFTVPALTRQPHQTPAPATGRVSKNTHQHEGKHP